ncbi:peptidoglycan-binding protein [Vineibacter terrae]|uniref:peptidoglycan-binding protein n=1 Tax=Vineibacter terrae TaxID=2586908 RepID=UPI002E3757D6|nr:peptidoglycan-binding protein [Vineibacter terrae]HEX2891223.1 peptidoglycan-binding protein [Vineibacter terrae]
MATIASRRRGAHADYTWPGYVDALASLLMVLVFLLAFYTVAQFALGSAVTEREQEISRLKGDVSSRDQAIDRLNRQIAQLGDLLSMERLRGGDLDKQVSVLTSRLRDETAARDKLAGDLAATERRVEGFTIEQGRLNKRIGELGAERDKLSGERDKLATQAAALTRDKATLEKQVTDLTAAQEKQARELTAAMSEREKLSAELLALTGDRDKLAALLKAAEAKALTASGDAEKAAAALRREIDRQKLELTRLAASLAAANQEKGKLWDDLTEEQKLSAESKAALVRMTAEMNATRAELERLTAALDAADAKAKDQQAQIVDLGQRLNRALASKVEELARYRSEFFGRMREALRNQPGINVVGDRFVFQSEVLFDKGSSLLKPEGVVRMTELALRLKEIAATIPPDINWVLQVEGHTDSVPISTPQFPSNWELSAARAIEVVKFFESQGLPPQRLMAAGYAANAPLEPGTSEAARSRNRRIEIRLTSR